MIERLQATYGFTRMPFGRDLAPQMLHRHTAHAEAVARITWCIDQHALGVLTGEVGVGKTVAVRAAAHALDRTRYQVIYVPNPAFGTRGLYVAIVSALGANPRFHKAEVMRQAADLLAAEETERHRRVVLVLDEAHLLTPEQLEELRLLTNAEMDSASPFALLLVGQPTRGVDIGAIEFVHRRLVALRDAGKALLVVSVELDEILSLADRILVMHDGRIVGDMPRAAATERARKVEPVWVRRLSMMRRKSTTALGEPWKAICTTRPSTAAAS